MALVRFSSETLVNSTGPTGLRLPLFLTPAATLFTLLGRKRRRRRRRHPEPALAGFDGLPTQSVLRVVAATAELGGNQVQRQVARIDVVLGATVVAGVQVSTGAATTDNDASAGSTVGVEVLCYAQVVLEGLREGSIVLGEFIIRTCT